MSLQDLQTVLQSQADGNGAVTVAESTLTAAGLTPAAGFDATIRTSLNVTSGLSVAFTGQVPAPVGNQLSLSGTAAFLGVTSVPTLVVLTLETGGTVDALIVATLPADWTFGTSFQALETQPFTSMTLTQPAFLVTTAAQTTYAWQPGAPALTLAKGLNVAALLGLDGPAALLLGLIDSLEPTGTVVLCGTIDPTTDRPAVALTGTIDAPITADTSFDLSLPTVLVTSEPDENGFLAYWLSFASTLNVGGQPFSTFQAALIEGSPNLCLTMTATGKPITPDEIIKLIGKVDYTQSIPSALTEVFSSVGLTGLGATFNVETPAVLDITGGIGTTSSWTLGDFTLENLTLNCSVMSPFDASPMVLAGFGATAQIFPDVFQGVFEFELTADTAGDLGIVAGFSGTVTLKDLVDGISGNTVDLPDCLQGIQFDDFGMSFAKGGDGSDWQIYGTAQGLFSLGLDTGPLNVTVTAVISSAGGQKTYQLVGALQIGEEFFDVEIDLGGAGSRMTASWIDQGEPLGFADVAAAFGWTSMPAVPPDLDLGLTGATLVYHFTDDSMAFGAQSRTYGEAAFVTLKTGQTRVWTFCLAGGQSFSLSDLPLVGDELARVEDVSIGALKVLAASAPIADPSAVNNLIQDLGGDYPLLPAQGVAGTLLISAVLRIGDDALPIDVAMGGPSRPQAYASAPAADGITWFAVQRSFGPVSINRIGVLYQSSQQALWFELDATLAFGPLTLNLDGLGVGSPLTSFAPQFCLQGLGVAYSTPPLEIAGTLINMEPPGSDAVDIEGGLIVSASGLTLEAFGYYGNASGFSSMFVFGDLSYAVGGPPAFFVTGAALGFGYNSALRLPSIDEVQVFPFVQVLPGSTAAKAGLFGPDPTPATVLDVIRKPQPPWVSDEAGALWFGAGITFTSYELVDSQAMLFVETGQELVISLVGDARASFPQPTGTAGEPCYASVELDLDVRFAPGEGVFSAQAVLARSSFLLDPACVLTGGFAFFVWYGDNPHAGDFVVTLGGYNPGFQRPAHYPAVPPVGFHWAMDSTISISGDAYLALTPAAMMVGGRLDATYQSGSLKAWFDAHADIVVRWKPFWFDAGIGITIGASYKMNLLVTSATVSVELGCDLEFWGPPTGGTVTVDWTVISFTVPFGSARQAGPRIKGWSDVEAMLPDTRDQAEPNILSATPTSGMIPTGASGPGSGDDTSWPVRGGTFGFTVTTPVPVTTAGVGSAHAFSGDTFDVHPLGWTGVSSGLTVTLTDQAGDDRSAAFDVAPLRAAVPASLWGAPPQNGGVPAGGAQLVPDQMTGLTIVVRPPRTGATPGPVDVGLALASVDLALPDAQLPLSGSAQPAGPTPANGGNTISRIADAASGIASDPVRAARASILTGLDILGYGPDTPDDPMTSFAGEAGRLFAAEPLMVG
ncbi:DUF6603 domain-containing protein [Nonomuraea sp. NPDC005692]|uniref:DUF6603 domain-containing protein n=1 Tax=Nonomuraea sp. NPDC005692 TaxID=3157168 RepID=UPI0033E0A197